ncbi:MAG: sensor histidine kinase, partial [Tepidisphaeraceae bacterium]
VARSSEHLELMLGRLRLLLVIVCSVATVALVALTGWVIRRGMRPVKVLAQQIASIGADDLAARLEVVDVPVELSPIVARLNELISRLESAFDREKSFTSDAAHELRTPLAGLQAALEVSARERRDVEHFQRLVGECLNVVRQMHSMIDNLLLLARADAGQVPVTRTPVNIGRLLGESWARCRSLADQRGLKVAFEVADDLVVPTDEEKLAIILNNLLDNAVHHANAAGRVDIDARASNGSVKIFISNTGSRVKAEDAQRVFDRFWRGDPSRSSNGRHCGLGLAVCRRLATALGSSIAVRSESDGMFVVQLSIDK